MFNINDSLIICIDVQEKLVNMLNKKCDDVKHNCKKLMEAASMLNIDVITVQQYPKGLGDTIESIKAIKNFPTIEKTTFSALKTPEFKAEFDKFNKKNILIFGIEAHICVLQSVVDLIKEGYNVFIVKDCCASRKKSDYKAALALAQSYGAKIITLEIALFNFLQSSKHQHFKEIQALIK